MRRAILTVVIVLMGAAYMAGFWPEHRRLTDVRTQLQEAQARLAAADERNRLAEVLGRLLSLTDAIAAKNYGEAATLSSSFFDAVRIEASRAAQSDVAPTLHTILNVRDQVTTAIASTDPSLGTVLKEQERSLRRVLGYAVGNVPVKPPS